MKNRFIKGLLCTIMIVSGTFFLTACGSPENAQTSENAGNSAEKTETDTAQETGTDAADDTADSDEADKSDTDKASDDDNASIVYRSEIYDSILTVQGLPGGVFLYGVNSGDSGVKYGLLSSKGEEITEAVYEYGMGLANKYIVLYKDGKWGAVDKDGNIVLDFAYDGFLSNRFQGNCNFYNSNGDGTYANHIMSAYDLQELDFSGTYWSSDDWNKYIVTGYNNGIALLYNPGNEMTFFVGDIGNGISTSSEKINLYEGVYNGTAMLAFVNDSAGYDEEKGCEIGVYLNGGVEKVYGPILSDGSMVGTYGCVPTYPGWTTAWAYKPDTEEFTSFGYLDYSTNEYIPLPDGIEGTYTFMHEYKEVSAIGGYGIGYKNADDGDTFIIDLNNGGAVINSEPYSSVYLGDYYQYADFDEASYYIRYSRSENGTEKLGYLDEETMQPATDAIYEEASAFMNYGDFAIVRQDGKLYVINKNLETVSEPFDGSSPINLGGDYFIISVEGGQQLIMVNEYN